ncbi:TraR/DksA family transcriptional regulator [uncultured Roseobacter sp.]|uniref:TraR/DksA family transcriptional regulator n=1 Tax=uncultured Roseobacter sp. TaxID=114847 RepID=UPI00261B9729|nr:TraR/DksA family transcriptional regulator [uncultured Roseobacter sp.]
MNITAQKKILLARREELASMMQWIEHQLDESPSKDWEDRSSERQGDEVLEAMGLADQAELRSIDAALDRIEKGTYGVCVTCGEGISDARLILVPATPFCRSCTA